MVIRRKRVKKKKKSCLRSMLLPKEESSLSLPCQLREREREREKERKPFWVDQRGMINQGISGRERGRGKKKRSVFWVSHERTNGRHTKKASSLNDFWSLLPLRSLSLNVFIVTGWFFFSFLCFPCGKRGGKKEKVLFITRWAAAKWVLIVTCFRYFFVCDC